MASANSENKLTLESFNQIYSKKIDDALTETVSQLDNKDKILKYLQGGKRGRAKLAMLVYLACNGKDESIGLKTAIASELAHNASLLKDDIIDKDVERRGEPTAWVQDGIVDSIKSADYMIITSLETLLSVSTHLVRSMLNGWKTAWQGESEDFKLNITDRIPEGPAYSVYFNVIKQKTASLFKFAADIASKAANADEDTVKKMNEYGEAVGIAYQLADDYVDIKKGKIQGSAKIPLFALAQIDEEMKPRLQEFLQGKFNLGELVLSLHVNIDEFFKNNINKYVSKAKEIASTMPETEYKKLLIEYPEWIVNQMLQEIKQQ
jgi:geranylgeranyl pyrophosphate synthase